MLKRTIVLVLTMLGPTVLGLGGCRTRVDNVALARHDPSHGHRLATTSPEGANTDETFVVLAFSGGGYRASALALGALEGLRDTRMEGAQGPKRLLDEVDLISSVSGGSFTAAYYGLFGERVFTDFKREVLYEDLQSDIVGATFAPWNLARLWSSDYDRSDLASERWGRAIFRDRTFADLRAVRSRPFIAINAVDLSSGTLFPFTQDTFDLLGSDLDPYPVGYGVVASAAVPVVTSPISLRNHPRPQGYTRPPWLEAARDSADRRRRWNARALAAWDEDKTCRRYMKLVDGGVADNTGLATVVHELEAGHIRTLRGRGAIRRMLVIAVNAMGSSPDALVRQSKNPALDDAAILAMSGPVDTITRQSLEAMAAVAARESSWLTFIELTLADIPEKKSREEMLAVETALSLPRTQIDGLVHWGRELLLRNETYRSFVAGAPPARATPIAPGPAALRAEPTPPRRASPEPSVPDAEGLPAPVIRRSAR
ncbi:MAG: patatin-like phospholipase family protein [Planctomycetota bacterium]|nr:patatin-like phospholipase family protein [Planctomycetota bacterium]